MIFIMTVKKVCNILTVSKNSFYIFSSLVHFVIAFRTMIRILIIYSRKNAII